MARLVWDQEGQRTYETGVNNCALFKKTASTYGAGVAWNGITSISESPSGAEATPLYADDIKYLNLYSAEEFGATIEAYTYPDEFAECDGSGSIANGVFVGQQKRSSFGLAYETTIGDDNGGKYKKLHLIYNATAAPSEKAYATINDSPEAITFSWTLTTTPVKEMVNEKEITTASVTIDSRKFTDGSKNYFKAIEDYIFGSESSDPKFPTLQQLYELATTGSVSAAG